jgi:dTDP-4-amino-4,6-dideoxygalactose transaminase
MDEKLALFGGQPTVTTSTKDGWLPPIEEEKQAVCELIDQQLLSGSGKGVGRQFEEEFRAYTGASFCLTVDHGSNAIMSALYAVGVGPGDEVLTPTLGYIGAYAGVIHLGARPIFCDVDPDSGLFDPVDAEKRITPRTRAILPIHFNGRVCDMDGLLYLREKHGIAIVQDACHAHPAGWDGVNLGNLPDIACYSLQGSDPFGKPVSSGEGGITTTNNREFYERMLIYCHLHRAGIVQELTNPVYRMLGNQGLGLKWRAHPLALAIARISLRNLDYRSERRSQHREVLYQALEEVPGVRPPRSYPKAQDGGFYGGLGLFYVPEELDGLAFSQYLAALRAEAVPVRPRRDPPEHLRTLFQRGFDLYGHGRGPIGPGAFDYKPGDFPVAEALHGRMMTVPAYIDPPDGLLEQIIAAFRKVARLCRSV